MSQLNTCQGIRTEDSVTRLFSHSKKKKFPQSKSGHLSHLFVYHIHLQHSYCLWQISHSNPFSLALYAWPNPSYRVHFPASFVSNEISWGNLLKPGLDFLVAMTSFIYGKEEIYSWIIMPRKATMFLEWEIIFLFLKHCSFGGHQLGKGLSKVERKTPSPHTYILRYSFSVSRIISRLH